MNDWYMHSTSLPPFPKGLLLEEIISSSGAYPRVSPWHHYSHSQHRHLPLQHTHCSGETLVLLYSVYGGSLPMVEPGFQMEEEFLATLTDSQVEEEHLGLKWQRQGWHYSRLLMN
ncbi:hypothetical protein K438DRAFT_226295 [Mycena galopus ATCC 62051]|nr:hypothetical protein K438DRAFT_226295 [Mycena galopus ATCC 62051]